MNYIDWLIGKKSSQHFGSVHVGDILTRQNGMYVLYSCDKVQGVIKETYQLKIAEFSVFPDFSKPIIWDNYKRLTREEAKKYRGYLINKK